MNTKPVGSGETREEAAASISAALDFLNEEAEAAGLSRVARLIRRASWKAKHDAEPSRSAADLRDACRAIVRLPEEYRSALVYRKVYRWSCQQIADGCGISPAAAKHRVARGFQLVRASLRATLPR